jgi:hypothetical protein
MVDKAVPLAVKESAGDIERDILTAFLGELIAVDIRKKNQAHGYLLG